MSGYTPMLTVGASPSSGSVRPLRIVVVGAVIGAIGIVLFGAMHAWLITPIWDRLFSGIGFAVASGIAIAWLYARVAAPHRKPWLQDGIAFGITLWMLLLPANLFAVLVRLAGLHNPAADGWEVAVGLLITGATATAWAHRHHRSPLIMLMSAFALSIIFAAMGGPVNVTRSAWATALLFAFIPIYVIAGLLLALAFRSGRLD